MALGTRTILTGIASGLICAGTVWAMSIDPVARTRSSKPGATSTEAPIATPSGPTGATITTGPPTPSRDELNASQHVGYASQQAVRWKEIVPVDCGQAAGGPITQIVVRMDVTLD